jgi:hypothetical protein
MNYKDNRTCDCCKRSFDGGMSSGKRTWWHLNHYHGFTGFFCPQCYDTVSHDSYNKPEDPAGLLAMTIKLGVKYETC